MLTAREAESVETEVLNLGADDYLRKPFSYAVLVARCRALAGGRPPAGRPRSWSATWCSTPAGGRSASARPRSS